MDSAGDAPNFQDQLQAPTTAYESRSITHCEKPSSLRALSAPGRLGHLNFPVFVMNLPLSLSARIPNNAWMVDLTPSEREVRLDRAIGQFVALYRHIAQHAIVYLLPSKLGLQDQTYVSNLGLVLAQED